MSGVQLTAHAVQRLAQRGMAMADLDLAALLGREVEGGLLVLDKDCERVARELKYLAERVRRLGGLRLVQSDGVLVTAYRAKPKKQRRLTRGAPRRVLD
jgi:hypothetical protein